MPEKATVEESRKAKRAGRAPTTQAGSFVREEIHHVREGKHGARSTKQAIAIGLSKARRAGVHLPPPPDTATPRTKESAKSANRAGKRRARPSPSALPGGTARAEARGPRSGIEQGAVETGEERIAPAARGRPQSLGAQGRADERTEASS